MNFVSIILKKKKKEKRQRRKAFFRQIKKINGTTIWTVSYLSQHVCHSLNEPKCERDEKKKEVLCKRGLDFTPRFYETAILY